MIPTHLAKNISANFMRAKQFETAGDSKRELRHLLFAVNDITKILDAPRHCYQEIVIARQYTESLTHTSIRIERILKEELNARNTF